jgi:hypothetical protein
VFVGVSDLARLQAIEARQRALDLERAEILHRWTAAGEWSDDGSATPAARLARDTGLSGQQARERVRVAGLLHSTMAVTMAAFAALGWAKVRLLAAAIDERTREAFVAHESVLVEHALTLSVDQLALFLRHWHRLVDEDGANRDADAMHDDQYVQLPTSWNGEGFLKGRLDPETTAIVKDALDALANEIYRAEKRDQTEARLRGEEPPTVRSASHRYALALKEMAKRSRAATTAVGAGAPVAPARPSVTVHIDADADGALRARFASGAPLPLSTAAKLVCDAAVAKVVTKDGLVPLQLGRTVRDPSPGQRKALGALWSTCAFAGCDRPFAWCDLHHVDWWERGGSTDVDRLVPLCDHHHTQHHKGVFEVRRRPDGTFVFERPDGTAIGDANPTISRILLPLDVLSRTAVAA